jgi:nitrogen fixation NifU-like protein
MSDQQALYQDLILDHYRRPRNRGALDDADVEVVMRNPLCSDDIELRLAFDGDRVRAARFTGQGCSISQASASMMTQLVTGKTVAEAAELRERVRRMLLGDAAGADESLGDLRALSGVARFPARVKCALLPWDALAEGLNRGGGGSGAGG